MGAAHPSAKEKKMPILNENDSPQVELSPGFERRELVSGELGAESLTVAHATLHPDGGAPLHTHPTEEAMVILEGEAVAWLGDDEVVVRRGQTVLAPAGVKHGFVQQVRQARPHHGHLPHRARSRRVHLA